MLNGSGVLLHSNPSVDSFKLWQKKRFTVWVFIAHTIRVLRVGNIRKTLINYNTNTKGCILMMQVLIQDFNCALQKKILLQVCKSQIFCICWEVSVNWLGKWFEYAGPYVLIWALCVLLLKYFWIRKESKCQHFLNIK